MQPDFNALAVFALVAEERNFRAAADRLGVTRSAVSQAIRKLERDIGAVLLQRTTRSVSLTEAGERLYAGIAPSIAEMKARDAEIARYLWLGWQALRGKAPEAFDPTKAGSGV